MYIYVPKDSFYLAKQCRPSFSYNSFVKFHGKKNGSHSMITLYQNLLYKKVCYKRTSLYIAFHLNNCPVPKPSMFVFSGLTVSESAKLCSFMHFREPKLLWEKSLLQRANLDKSLDFMDCIEEDCPKGIVFTLKPHLKILVSLLMKENEEMTLIELVPPPPPPPHTHTHTKGV